MDFLKEPKRLDPREDCDVFCSFQWVGGISIRRIYRPPGSGISFGVYIRHFVLTLPNHSIVWSLLDSALFSLSFFFFASDGFQTDSKHARTVVPIESLGPGRPRMAQELIPTSDLLQEGDMSRSSSRSSVRSINSQQSHRASVRRKAKAVVMNSPSRNILSVKEPAF